VAPSFYFTAGSPQSHKTGAAKQTKTNVVKDFFVISKKFIKIFDF